MDAIADALRLCNERKRKRFLSVLLHILFTGSV
jgi:hypothetical protein